MSSWPFVLYLMASDCFSHKMKMSHLRFEGAICLQNINKGYFIYAQRVMKFFIFM